MSEFLWLEAQTIHGVHGVADPHSGNCGRTFTNGVRCQQLKGNDQSRDSKFRGANVWNRDSWCRTMLSEPFGWRLDGARGWSLCGPMGWNWSVGRQLRDTPNSRFSALMIDMSSNWLNEATERISKFALNKNLLLEKQWESFGEGGLRSCVPSEIWWIF